MRGLQQTPKMIDTVVSARAAARLRAFRRDVEQAFDGQLNNVLLFGSRARGEARRGSDYDVAVVFNGNERTAEMRQALSDLAYPFVKAGTPIRPVAIFAGEFDSTGLIPVARNISRDGIVIF